MSDFTDDLLRALLASTGRVAISPAELKDQVARGSNQAKQIRAYNLANGTRTQAQIARELSIDSGNFSRTVDRWLRFGLIFKIGPNSNLQHLYPIAEDEAQ